MSDFWPPDDPERDEPEQEESAPPPEPVFPEWPVYEPPRPQLQPGEGEPYGEGVAPEAPVVSGARKPRDPLARLFPGLPRGARVALDWILTIAGAVLIVFALKLWVVNPYRIPSSSMEPTL
ncbi:MAG TPA: S26 family signal peptidase, partial [Gaiellaceae bacterium]|nr:S26 family signal peptidase [Gaiellaceae bacterium]